MIQGAKIKVSGKAVAALNGLGRCNWIKGPESKTIMQELAAAEGTQESSDSTTTSDEEEHGGREMEIEEPAGADQKPND